MNSNPAFVSNVNSDFTSIRSPSNLSARFADNYGRTLVLIAMIK